MWLSILSPQAIKINHVLGSRNTFLCQGHINQQWGKNAKQQQRQQQQQQTEQDQYNYSAKQTEQASSIKYLLIMI